MQSPPAPLLDHWVQFYETDAFLAETVTTFLYDGLALGEGVIVIATGAHRQQFLDALRVKGVDIDDAISGDRLVLLDAAGTLDRLMIDDAPSSQRFHDVVGAYLGTLGQDGRRGVRAYGEMVDLLWRDGNFSAAIRLEELWNDLRQLHTFRLLCSYAIDSFYTGNGIPRVCATHSHVLLPELSQRTDAPQIPTTTMHALISEIGHRRDVEAALRASKDELEDFLDNAAIAIHRVDRQGIIRYVNREEIELLGYSRDELVGHHISELHVDPAECEKILQRLGRGETLRDYDARLRARDGSIRYVQITSNAQIRDGELLSSRCFTRDVTPARQTARLHTLTAALSRALTAEEVARIVIHEARNVIGVSAGCVILLNTSGTEIERFLVDEEVKSELGAAALSLELDMPACEAARTQRVVWVVGTDAIRMRYPHLSSLQSSARIHTWGAVPIMFEGRTLGAIGLRCAYERPLQPDEEMLLIAIARHCGLAIERAHLHDAAEIARKHAERASRAKDEFLAMLGHELRNPLSPILSAVQLMRLRGDDSMTRELDIIDRQVSHLIHLVDDLLDVSRIEQGKVELERRPVKLAGIVHRAIEIVAPLCRERTHQLTVALPHDEIWIEADDTRLCQVFTNLLTNAIKYTKPGGQLDVRVRPADGMVNVHVKDNGNGIAPELLPRIFDLFVQGERTTERSRGGLGVGLALVRNLVTMHGGTVSASSNGLGYGSEFVVRLPVLDVRRATTPLAVEHLRSKVEVTPRRILVVDDNQDAAEMLGEMLGSLGHETVVALDGQQALTALERFTPDVAILDIGLPDTDGYELASELRKQLGPSVRLMAVTGFGQQQDRDRAQSAGFDAHFTKPVGLGKLLAAIER